MASAQVVEVLLTGNATGLKAAFAEGSAAAGETSATMTEKMAGIGKAATFAFAGAAVAVGVFSLKMADDFEQAHARLETAIKNVGSSFDEEKSKISDVDSKMEQLGFTNAETENSLSRLVAATGNVTTSTGLMGLAADIARARGIDLATATDMLVKVEGGRYTALGKTLGVSKDVIASFHDQGDAIDFLTKKFGGQAAAYADTFSGKLEVMKATVEDLGVKIGLALIPVIEGLATALSSTINFFEKHKEVAAALGVVIGGPLVAAMATYIATQAMAIGSSIMDFWTSLSAKALTLTGSVTTLDAALLAETQSMMVAAGATEAEAAAVLGLDEAAAAGAVSLAAFALPLAAIAAVGYGISQTMSGLSVSIDSAGVKAEEKAGKFDLLTKQMSTMGKLTGDASTAQRTFNDVLKNSPEYAQQFIAAADKAGVSTKGWADQLRAHISAQQSAKAAQELYNAGVDGGTTKIDAQNIALQKNIDMLSKQADAQIGAQNAQLATKDAMLALYGATMNAAASSGQDAAANEALQKATLNAESAILRQASAAVTASGNSADYRTTLEGVASTLDPSSPLYQWLAGYIAKLNTTPAAKSTTISINDDASWTLDQLRAKMESLVGTPWVVSVGVTADLPVNKGGSNPFIVSDRNMKRDVVPVPA